MIARNEFVNTIPLCDGRRDDARLNATLIKGVCGALHLRMGPQAASSFIDSHCLLKVSGIVGLYRLTSEFPGGASPLL
jgi:hypothetical protein